MENRRGNARFSISGRACSLDMCIAYKLFPHHLVEISHDSIHIFFLAAVDLIRRTLK